MSLLGWCALRVHGVRLIATEKRGGEVASMDVLPLSPNRYLCGLGILKGKLGVISVVIRRPIQSGRRSAAPHGPTCSTACLFKLHFSLSFKLSNHALRSDCHWTVWKDGLRDIFADLSFLCIALQLLPLYSSSDYISCRLFIIIWASAFEILESKWSIRYAILCYALSDSNWDHVVQQDRDKFVSAIRIEVGARRLEGDWISFDLVLGRSLHKILGRNLLTCDCVLS